MQSIHEYLINKQTKEAHPDIDILLQDYRTHHGETPLLWYRIYKILYEEGPTSKQDVLKKLGLQPTSYSTSFAKWSRDGVIVPSKKQRGKLEAVDPKDWKAPELYLKSSKQIIL